MTAEFNMMLCRCATTGVVGVATKKMQHTFDLILIQSVSEKRKECIDIKNLFVGSTKYGRSAVTA